MLSSLLKAALISLALTQSGQAVSVSVPPWITGGSCVSDVSGVRTEARASAMVVACGDVGRLRCDLDTAEPLEVDIKSVCAAGRLPVLQGRVRVVEVEAPETITVEWIEWSEGQAPVVLATRPLSRDGHVVAARAANRFLRFSRPGRSPLTIPESDLTDRGPSRLPAAVAGGELLVAVALAPVRPRAVRLETGSSVVLGQFAVDATGRARVPGLPAGKVTWRPVYEGGVAGSASVAEVASERSTSIVISRQDVGQLRVRLDADLCADARQTKVTAVRLTGTGGRIEDERIRASVDSTCSHVFAGLQPGNHEIRVDGGSVSLAVVQAIMVESQQEAIVEMAAPPVTLSGTILLNGRPYPRPDLVVRFQRPEDPPDGGVHATVLPAGGYSVRLPAPGRYLASLAVRELPLIGIKRDIVVTAGQNFSDWAIDGGTLKVRVERWDHSSPVQITFKPLDSRATRVGYANFILEPADDAAFELPGIQFGLYSLQARQVLPDNSTRVSTTEQTEVRDTGPPAEVTLALAEYSSEISLVDRAGQPVLTPAKLFSPRQGPLTPVTPGLFRATSSQLSAGDPVPVLAAGYLATCILAPPNGGATTVTLQPSIRTQVEVRSSVRWGVIPGWVTVPGASCPIELGLFAKERLEPESIPGGDVISRFVISQLPADQRVLFQLNLAEAPTPLIRNAEGVVVIRRY